VRPSVQPSGRGPSGSVAAAVAAVAAAAAGDEDDEEEAGGEVGMSKRDKVEREVSREGDDWIAATAGVPSASSMACTPAAPRRCSARVNLRLGVVETIAPAVLIGAEDTALR
jgi:hypothetical protein